MRTSACTSSGGTFTNGGCPRDAADVKCCSKPRCNNGPSGNCRWVSDCPGPSSTANLCPGPNAFQCCSKAAGGGGGYKAPRIPPVGACKQVAVNGAKKIVEVFPGRIREIGCYRDGTCEGDHDHPCGKANDLMCSDADGVNETNPTFFFSKRMSLLTAAPTDGHAVWPGNR